ncbi:response regulator transcription factor [Saccharopolyspora indica]|uniref:helix-turn-helix transcriptional regulator n=1 Tax=Saccharopolyspora indica TaxID=1229659 RepID=UPI0022EB9C69|nr:response regulator transcription factor [Saccharopolyspora indica]MDA3648678.1 response regulator transcription factor [Saccharopolyspora indica]
MSTAHNERALAHALKTIDDFLAHFQVMNDLAREARDRLAAYRDVPKPALQVEVGMPAPLPQWENSVKNSTNRPDVQLTQRQQDVLELLVQGATNRRIGRVLHITEQTVKAHLHMIYRKLGVADRTEAVVIAMRFALVPDGLPAASRLPHARETVS